MKIFDEKDGWRESINFVDDNNVFVGYSLGQDCCEYADWFIADNVVEEFPDKDLKAQQDRDLEGFVFDREFFKQVDGGNFDGGALAVFRLTKGDQVKYLHLFNYHNGYYGHGFEVKHGGELVREGVL